VIFGKGKESNAKAARTATTRRSKEEREKECAITEVLFSREML
jgi:hypothetical protein